MSKKISMQIIANRLGLSKYSVSQALSGKPGVSRESRLRILELAEVLGYRTKQTPLRQLVQENSESVSTGTLFVYIKQEFRGEPDFWARILEGLLASCMEAGWDCKFIDDAVGPGSFMELVKRALNPLGIIVIGISQRSHLLVLQSCGLPMVLVDHEDPLISADVILNDNMEASRIACNHLFAQGCSSLIFIGRDSLAVSFKERWWGCKLAVDEWNKANPGLGCTLQKWNVSNNPTLWQQQLDRRILGIDSNHWPVAFLCANDLIAIQLLTNLKQHNIAVPDLCRIIGIDNIEASASTEPPLTTVELAKETLGMRAVQALQRRLQNGHAIREKIILSAELIIRKSG
jgi:LacI family transcriptional regulator